MTTHHSAPQAHTVTQPLASGWDRLVAFLLDGWITGLPILLLLIWLLRTATLEEFIVVGIKVVILLMSFGWLTTLYTVGLRARFQRTVGMYCLGLSLVKLNHGHLSWREVAFRELIGKMASHYLLGWGFLGAWRHPQRQAWHDRLVDSVVVRTEMRPTGLKIYVLIAALLLQVSMGCFLARLMVASPVVLNLLTMMGKWAEAS